MADKALDTYLNDHLGGAMLGSDLAEQIRDRSEGTPLGDKMAKIATEVEEDRQSLIDLMEALGTSRNPVKQASAWVAEKASRLKFAGWSSGEPEFGLFMAVETLALGVEGKLSLWKALKEVEGDYPALAPAELDNLIARAQSQRESLEGERISASRSVLGQGAGGAVSQS
jgi:hypothetical protein